MRKRQQYRPSDAELADSVAQIREAVDKHLTNVERAMDAEHCDLALQAVNGALAALGRIRKHLTSPNTET